MALPASQPALLHLDPPIHLLMEGKRAICSKGESQQQGWKSILFFTCFRFILNWYPPSRVVNGLANQILDVIRHVATFFRKKALSQTKAAADGDKRVQRGYKLTEGLELPPSHSYTGSKNRFCDIVFCWNSCFCSLTGHHNFLSALKDMYVPISTCCSRCILSGRSCKPDHFCSIFSIAWTNYSKRGKYWKK